MKMRGLADQLVTWMLILLVIFTGTTLAQLDREQLLVQIRANISKISDGETVSENDTHLLLDHDYYFQEDFIDGAFDKDVLDKLPMGKLLSVLYFNINDYFHLTIRPNFQMKLFGTEYDAVDVYAKVLMTQNSKERVIITPLVNSFGGVHIQSLQTDDFLAIRWPQLRFLSDSTSHPVKIIVVLYKNGIITMKYEEIPFEIDSKHLISEMICKFDLYIEIKSVCFTL
ncbi:plexin domain containing 2 precursor [Schistosoma japonicum]|nr:plexin domain containing 2 precursor [Schistosoma japonicum]